MLQVLSDANHIVGPSDGVRVSYEYSVNNHFSRTVPIAYSAYPLKVCRLAEYSHKVDPKQFP